ncbi:conjugal transfer protein MobB [uncultured Duncaniella sp.]|uniref:conjugal transfer protein MobB n=1 Tax=uncultured Duncaniella sp. TaxID=2768039 RepID=UPI00266DD2D0|nr:conjugal transfer protein MobB [uncultured Duncaniella sp.]
MVAKISIGSSLYGALCYNGEKVNKENGRILGSNKIIIPVDGKADIDQMAENFRMFMPKMGKTKKPVLHISLNPHPDDRLSDQDFEILAREYLDKLGFGEQPYVIYKHEDIDRHHIHIVTVNVNEEGKRLNQDFLYRRSKKITTELEEKYNLHKAQREKISPDTPITKIDPTGDIKRQVANTVKMVGMRYKFQSMGEYNAILGLYNVRCDTADGRVNGREYHGLVYFATDDNGNTIATPLKASRLGKFASRTAIDGRFERAKEKIDVAPTKRKVADVLNQSSGKDDFVAKLKERNVDVVFRYTDEGRIYGVTFVDHDTMTALNGSRLGKDFSANALNARFSHQSQPTEQAPTAKVVPIPTPTNTTSESQSTSSAGTAPAPTQSQSANSNSGDYDFTLPGLDLFQPGQSFNPDEAEFRRRMQRKKKGIRRRF